MRDVAHASPIWATAATQDASQTHGLLKVDLLRTHVLLRRLLALILPSRLKQDVLLHMQSLEKLGRQGRLKSRGLDRMAYRLTFDCA